MCSLVKWLLLITGLLVLPGSGTAPVAPKPKDYLYYVQTFASTLLNKGLDRYGSRRTALWCAVMDARDLSVPRQNVPFVEGIRPGDRAVGGSNLYHDVATLKAFRVLSDVTGNSRYANAATGYLRDFLTHAQSPVTGLLGWGEHLYYDVYEDRVRVEEAYGNRQYGGLWHEFLGNTPPWAALWEVDSVRTQKAITGIQYHFFEPEPDTFLFNRHAHWDKAQYQTADKAQPWIKHTGLYTYSYAFLYGKTENETWLRRAKGTGALYWDRRHPQTGLTLSCIGDKRPFAQHASLSSMTMLAYFLHKAGRLVPAEETWRAHALAFLRSISHYAWDPAAQMYYSALTVEGKPVADETDGKPLYLKAWVSGYGVSSVLNAGRIAAYFARQGNDPQFLEMARRAALIASKEPLPDHFVAENMADAIHLNLDLHELTKEQVYLTNARTYADLAIGKLWRNGLFTRQTDDPYYEAKLGIGDLVAGLLRLHLLLHPGSTSAGAYDWDL